MKFIVSLIREIEVFSLIYILLQQVLILLSLNFCPVLIDLSVATGSSKYLPWTDMNVNNKLFSHMSSTMT